LTRDFRKQLKEGYNVTYGYVYSLLKREGFARLPRRGKQEKKKLELPKIKAPDSCQFDFIMTFLAYNLYRLFALELERYNNLTAERIYEKFITNNGNIQITKGTIQVELKKKRDLPQLLEMMKSFSDLKYPWLKGYKIEFHPSSTS